MTEAEAQLRALQGDKDRAVKRVEQKVDDFEKKFAEAQKLISRGYSEDEAFEQIRLKETVEQLKAQIQQNAPAHPQSAGNGNGVAIDAAQVLAQYKLDGNDPEVVAQVLSKSNPLELENAALKLAYRRSNPTPPDPAASTAVTNTPPKNDAAEGLKREYQTKLEALQKEGRPNPAQIAELKAQMRKKGLEVW